ncbi:MAG: hypothetical protein H7837_13880, partial [Magnetococcus sp. MYC-9]
SMRGSMNFMAEPSADEEHPTTRSVYPVGVRKAIGFVDGPCGGKKTHPVPRFSARVAMGC